MSAGRSFVLIMVAGCTTYAGLEGPGTPCESVEVLETLEPDEVSSILLFTPDEVVDAIAAEATTEGYDRDAGRVMQVVAATAAHFVGPATVEDFGDQDCRSGVHMVVPISLTNSASIEGFAIEQEYRSWFLATAPAADALYGSVATDDSSGASFDAGLAELFETEEPQWGKVVDIQLGPVSTGSWAESLAQAGLYVSFEGDEFDTVSTVLVWDMRP